MAAWLLTLALLRTGDGITTVQAFNHGRVEAVPWMPHTRKGVIIGQTAIFTTEAISLLMLDKKGHPKAARVFCTISIGTESAGIMINVLGNRR